MSIGLYFGSFNPIHNGHIKISEEILKKTEIDNIWMVLSPQSPEKSSILDKNIRLRLMEIALRGLKNIIKLIIFPLTLPYLPEGLFYI